MAEQKEYQDNREEQQQQGSSIDRANDLINKGRSVRKKYQQVQKLYRGIKAARTAAAASQGVGAAAATSEIWAPILAIILLIIVVIIFIIVIFPSPPPPVCENIEANPDTASSSQPTTISLTGCIPGSSFKYTEAPALGGVFSSPTSESTLYTPPPVTVSKTVTITVAVCSNKFVMLCTEYVLKIEVVPGTATDCTNIAGQYCSPEPCGSGEVIGRGLCTNTSGPNCCRAKFKFYCQYDPDWQGTCNISGVGCSPTSTAMIMATFEGAAKWNPVKVALANNRVAGCYDSTTFSELYNRVLPWLRNLGYKVGPNLASGRSFNVSAARSYLSQGYYLLAGADIYFNRSRWSYPNMTLKAGGHAFVISNIDINNNGIVYDPTFCFTDTQYKTRSFKILPVGYPISDGGWYWAIPIKK